MHNLLKVYNALLDVDALSPKERILSLRRVFDRDIPNNAKFGFRGKKIYPIPTDGQDKIDLLFAHLTTKVIDPQTKHREYDRPRSIRLHWIKFHIEERKHDDMLVFSTINGREKRTYIYDVKEKYVIVLEPKSAKRENGQIYRYYYFLTAYPLEGKDAKRNKIEKLYARRIDEIL